MSKLNGMLMIGSAGANVGKTTAATKLAQRACAEGFTVAGLLAPSAAEAIVVSDPASEETNIGPVVSSRQWERVQSYIQKGIEEEADAR